MRNRKVQEESEKSAFKEQAQFVLEALEYAEPGTIQWRCPDCRQFYIMKDFKLLKSRLESHICQSAIKGGD